MCLGDRPAALKRAEQLHPTFQEPFMSPLTIIAKVDSKMDSNSKDKSMAADSIEKDCTLCSPHLSSHLTTSAGSKRLLTTESVLSTRSTSSLLPKPKATPNASLKARSTSNLYLPDGKTYHPNPSKEAKVHVARRLRILRAFRDAEFKDEMSNVTWDRRWSWGLIKRR